MCEPLRDKKQMSTFHENLNIETFDASDIKSAVDFYKKYRGLGLFKYEEYNHLKDTEELWELYTSSEHPVMSFKDWLFDYCFGDVTE